MLWVCNINDYGWQQHCRGLFHTPNPAWVPIRQVQAARSERTKLDTDELATRPKNAARTASGWPTSWRSNTATGCITVAMGCDVDGREMLAERIENFQHQGGHRTGGEQPLHAYALNSIYSQTRWITKGEAYVDEHEHV